MNSQPAKHVAEEKKKTHALPAGEEDQTLPTTLLPPLLSLSRSLICRARECSLSTIPHTGATVACAPEFELKERKKR